VSKELKQLVTRLEGEAPVIAVVGLGYVGLPLALAFAQGGARVRGIDVSEAVCARLHEGHSHVDDVSDDELAAGLAGGPGSAGLTCGTDFAIVAEADAIVICVPTPLRKTKDPDISHVVKASEAVTRHARAGQLVVLESTTYPGTTEEILVPLLRGSGHEPGRDVAVAFSPERVDPGNPTYGLGNTPKVVGGFTAACSAAARALYGRLGAPLVEVSSPAAAETVKLLENTFRSVNIGLVNEFALICRRLGLDVWEIVDAAATKPFGFMPFRPGPGLGGHCIPVDPHYLAWKLRSLDFQARFIELADAVNSRMPEHAVGVVADALNERERSVKGSKILMLGVTYKKDIADVRESPALEILRLLLERGADLAFHDPHVDSVMLGEHRLEGVPLDDETLAGAHCVLIATDHSSTDVARVVSLAQLVVDTRNATGSLLAADPSLAAKVHRI
jgi:UDP-N-acetyl-D-glucosamine dehydrogenase